VGVICILTDVLPQLAGYAKEHLRNVPRTTPTLTSVAAPGNSDLNRVKEGGIRVLGNFLKSFCVLFVASCAYGVGGLDSVTGGIHTASVSGPSDDATGPRCRDLLTQMNDYLTSVLANPRSVKTVSELLDRIETELFGNGERRYDLPRDEKFLVRPWLEISKSLGIKFNEEARRASTLRSLNIERRKRGAESYAAAVRIKLDKRYTSPSRAAIESALKESAPGDSYSGFSAAQRIIRSDNQDNVEVAELEGIHAERLSQLLLAFVPKIFDKTVWNANESFREAVKEIWLMANGGSFVPTSAATFYLLKKIAEKDQSLYDSILKFEESENLLLTVGKSFGSHSEGAEAIRSKLVEQRVHLDGDSRTDIFALTSWLGLDVVDWNAAPALRETALRLAKDRGAWEPNTQRILTPDEIRDLESAEVSAGYGDWLLLQQILHDREGNLRRRARWKMLAWEDERRQLEEQLGRSEAADIAAFAGVLLDNSIQLVSKWGIISQGYVDIFKQFGKSFDAKKSGDTLPRGSVLPIPQSFLYLFEAQSIGRRIPPSVREFKTSVALGLLDPRVVHWIDRYGQGAIGEPPVVLTPMPLEPTAALVQTGGILLEGVDAGHRDSDIKPDGNPSIPIPIPKKETPEKSDGKSDDKADAKPDGKIDDKGGSTPVKPPPVKPPPNIPPAKKAEFPDDALAARHFNSVLLIMNIWARDISLRSWALQQSNGIRPLDDDGLRSLYAERVMLIELVAEVVNALNDGFLRDDARARLPEMLAEVRRNSLYTFGFKAGASLSLLKLIYNSVQFPLLRDLGQAIDDLISEPLVITELKRSYSFSLPFLPQRWQSRAITACKITGLAGLAYMAIGHPGCDVPHFKVTRVVPAVEKDSGNLTEDINLRVDPPKKTGHP
jgi:hypothetical protein